MGILVGFIVIVGWLGVFNLDLLRVSLFKIIVMNGNLFNGIFYKNKIEFIFVYKCLCFYGVGFF